MRDLEARQPLSGGRQHHDLMLGACQVQPNDHILMVEAAPFVSHVDPSFVSWQTREGILQVGRPCRLPPSHTLILDNGSEFINRPLYYYCGREGITFTRSRAYRKNDSAHVEQKNGTLVRALVGHDRYTSRAAYAQLACVYRLLRWHSNFF